ALGRASDAEAAARAALASEPSRPRALLSLALALDAQQRAAEAVDVVERLLVLQPKHPIPRRMHARSLLHAGRTAAARATALHPAIVGDEAIADALADEFVASAPQATLILLGSLSRRYPRSYHWTIRGARLLHQLGRSSEALAWSERAHALRP